jgi:hypothetical protein
MGSVNSHGLLEDLNHYIVVGTDGIYGSSSRVAEQKYVGTGTYRGVPHD